MYRQLRLTDAAPTVICTSTSLFGLFGCIKPYPSFRLCVQFCHLVVSSETCKCESHEIQMILRAKHQATEH